MVMAKQDNRPSWFKVFQNQGVQIDGMSDEEAGQVLKAALKYFKTREIPEMSPVVRIVFLTFKTHIDESFQDFETGRKQRTYARWKATHPNGTKEEFEIYYRSKNNDL